MSLYTASLLRLPRSRLKTLQLTSKNHKLVRILSFKDLYLKDRSMKSFLRLQEILHPLALWNLPLLHHQRLFIWKMPQSVDPSELLLIASVLQSDSCLAKQTPKNIQHSLKYHKFNLMQQLYYKHENKNDFWFQNEPKFFETFEKMHSILRL